VTRRLIALAAAAMVVGLGSCSDDTGNERSDASAPDPSPTESATAEDLVASLPDEEELAQGLLTIEDLPTGWGEVPQDDDEDEPLCGIRISELLGLDADTLPSATAVYAGDPDVGPGFGESIGFVPSGRGPDVLPAFREAIDGCDGDTMEGFDATVSALSFPPLGDDSAAYRVTLTDPESGQSTNIDVVYAVAGDLAAVMYAFDLSGDPTDTLTTYAPKALDRAVRTLGRTASGG
jgi:hypothetical protein